VLSRQVVRPVPYIDLSRGAQPSSSPPSGTPLKSGVRLLMDTALADPLTFQRERVSAGAVLRLGFGRPQPRLQPRSSGNIGPPFRNTAQRPLKSRNFGHRFRYSRKTCAFLRFSGGLTDLLSATIRFSCPMAFITDCLSVTCLLSCADTPVQPRPYPIHLRFCTPHVTVFLTYLCSAFPTHANVPCTRTGSANHSNRRMKSSNLSA
jgi:hypothetical protein